MKCFGIFTVISLNKLFDKHSSCWWFEMSYCSCSITVMKDRSWYSLKRKCRHSNTIFITGCTESCQNGNLQMSQWWKFQQNEKISTSVFWWWQTNVKAVSRWCCLLPKMIRQHTYIIVEYGRMTERHVHLLGTTVPQVTLKFKCQQTNACPWLRMLA